MMPRRLEDRTMPKPAPIRRNPIARALRSGVCRPQTVPARKGPGAYRRKPRMTAKENCK